MALKKPKLSQSARQSPRHRAAALKNLEKAWQANRSQWEFTPARRSASLWTIKKAHMANRMSGRPVSAAQREAARRNVAKARKALQARGRSPEHLARLRESIAKARAARTDKSIERQAQKVLSHGLFARRLRGPVGSLGENPRDYEAIHRLVGRFLCPQNEEEEKLAHLIADSLWRQHRMFFAQAAWQLKSLDFFLSKAPPLEVPDPDETRLRAYALVAVLIEEDDSRCRAWRLIGTTQRLLRRFLRLRFGRDPDFHPDTDTRWRNPFAGVSLAERIRLTGDIDGMEAFDPFDKKWS